MNQVWTVAPSLGVLHVNQHDLLSIPYYNGLILYKLWRVSLLPLLLGSSKVFLELAEGFLLTVINKQVNYLIS